MSKIDLNDLSKMQYDVLSELGNIGAGNATTALATMINRKIDIVVPHVRLVDFDQISTIIGPEEDVKVGILIMLNGDVNGMMMFLLDNDIAKNLVNILMGRPDGSEVIFDDLERSVVMEIGNIIAGAYLNSLSVMTNLNIEVSVPMLQIDMAGAILSVPAIEFGKIGDKVLLIETEFDGEVDKSYAINGYYILVPELESYEKILESLGV